MTSLTGASGEDFASILRSLGYRMDRRPKPPEPPPVAEAAPAAAAESKVAEELTGTSDAGSSALLPDVAMISDATLDVGSDLTAGSVTEAGEIADVVPQEAAVDAPVDAPAEAQALPSESETVAADTVPVAADREAQLENAAASPGTGEESKVAVPDEAPVAPAEPVMIEVWLPGRAVRPEGARRPRQRREHRRDAARGAPQPQTGDGAATPAVAGSEAGGAAPQTDGAPAREGRHSHRRRGGQGHGERHGERHGGERRGGERHAGEQRQDRPPRDRDRGHDRGHGKRFERRERDKAPDPNSPFAKLAALKAQLEADAKERR
jgi:ATP-dependent RNA helicase SUPV3L1/SUV3